MSAATSLSQPSSDSPQLELLLEALKGAIWPKLQEVVGDQNQLSVCSEMPAWARSLVLLGAWSAFQKTDGSQVRWVLVVPEREYAGLFVALGGLIGSMSSEPDSRPVRTDDFVHWIQDGKLHSGRVKGESVGLPNFVKIEGLKGITWDLPRDNLIVTNGRISLEMARVAVWASQLISSLGIPLSAGDLILPVHCVTIAGARTAIVEQSKRLGFNYRGEHRTIEKLAFMAVDQRRHALTSVVSATEKMSVVDWEVGLTILDGPDAIRLLQFDPDDRHAGLARTKMSTVLLLTEHEFAKYRIALDDCYADWGGRWIGKDVIGNILGDAQGAVVMGKIQS